MTDENQNLSRIRRISRRLQRLLWIALAIPPLALLYYWGFHHTLPPETQAGARLGIVIVEPLPAALRTLAFGLTMAGASISMWGVYALIRLFRLYESGRIFLAENVACFRTIGRVCIAQAAANVLLVPVLSVILTLNNPAGQKQLALSFGSGSFFLLLAGGVILVIAAVMEEGRKLEEDRQLTV
ncbi:MAG: DUF2975 domain-containing protein [bacterium]|nr:DUF2975 domain-containing protein [bacterium]